MLLLFFFWEYFPFGHNFASDIMFRIWPRLSPCTCITYIYYTMRFQVLITTFGEIDEIEYLDPRSYQVAIVNHVKQVIFIPSPTILPFVF